MMLSLAVYDVLAAQQKAYAQLAMKYMLKSVAVQQQMLQACTDTAFKDLRAALAVTDKVTLRAYLEAQPVRVRLLLERMRTDLDGLGSLSQAYAAELRSLVEKAREADAADAPVEVVKAPIQAA